MINPRPATSRAWSWTTRLSPTSLAKSSNTSIRTTYPVRRVRWGTANGTATWTCWWSWTATSGPRNEWWMSAVARLDSCPWTSWSIRRKKSNSACEVQSVSTKSNQGKVLRCCQVRIGDFRSWVAKVSRTRRGPRGQSRTLTSSTQFVSYAAVLRKYLKALLIARISSRRLTTGRFDRDGLTVPERLMNFIGAHGARRVVLHTGSAINIACAAADNARQVRAEIQAGWARRPPSG